MRAGHRGSPRVRIRLQPSKRRIWEAAAAQEQLTLSAFIRKACDEAATAEAYLTHEEIEAYHAAAEQLRGAGIKLNALLRNLHAV
ncbi:DUF1778 domain-containing protein [Rhodovibrio salinarum]|uniref:DUF1778 domain-containing protein n=1 Tax=Rhodovibrio salinarum TaxID=1087 RepID=A0A934UZP6_9PROT|nr:DUF1778 domain-containing protein [Rhodovibrio salinarum]